MSETNDSIKEFLADHPRAIGVLFALLVTLSQAGTAAAKNAGSTIV